ANARDYSRLVLRFSLRIVGRLIHAPEPARTKQQYPRSPFVSNRSSPGPCVFSMRDYNAHDCARRGGGAAVSAEETRRDLQEETVPPPTGTIFVMGMYMLVLMAAWAVMFWLLVGNS